MTRAVALPENEDGHTFSVSHGLIAWIETVAITVVSTAVAVGTGPSHLASFQASCIWLVGPIVCGLRHGSRHGLASAACLVALIAIWSWHVQPTFAWQPLTDAAAIILVGGAAGEISDWWRRRLNCLEAEGHYHRLRLEEFSREYHSLRLSHSCLEQKLAAGGASLRNALLQLNQRISSAQASGDEPLGGLGDTILRVFAEHAPLHMAALYCLRQTGPLHFVRRARQASGAVGNQYPDGKSFAHGSGGKHRIRWSQVT